MEKNIKVLLVDDEDDFLQPMAFWLGSKGYYVITASDGPGAIERVKEKNPDIIFMDLNMPGMDGIETFKQIRSFNKTIPVIIISAYLDQQKIGQLAPLGISGVFYKGSEFEESLTLLETTLRTHSLLLHKATLSTAERQQQILFVIQHELKRISHLIEDFLDISALEKGKEIKIERRIVSIIDIIDESVKDLAGWAKAKSVTIDKKIQGDIPQINVDPNRITQVLNNLIGNAIKLTPTGGRVDLEVGRESEKEIKVSVKDSGPGMDRKELARIFERSYQAENLSPMDIGGLSLGLSVVKEMIELHEGRIWAESEKGKGVKFIFVLPVSI